MKHILTILIFIIPFCLFADYKTDSLINIVHEYEKKVHFESDTNYINALIDVAEEFKRIQPDTSLLFSDKAYELSKKHGYPKGVFQSLLIKASYYIGAGDTEKQLEIANEMLPIAEETDRRLLNSVYNIFGTAYVTKGLSDRVHYIKAEEMFKKALSIAEEYNDIVRSITILGNLGCVHIGQSDNTSALEVFYRAVNLAEKHHPEYNTSILLYNMALIYQLQDRFDQALIEAHKGIEVAKKNNDIIQLGRCLYLAGEVYQNQNKIDEALDYINRSVDIFGQLGLIKRAALAKEVLVDIYIKQELLDKALVAAYEILEIWEAIDGSDYDIVFTKLKIARIYYSQKQYAPAMKICNEVLASEINNLRAFNTLHGMMSQIYEAQNNKMKALEHYKLYKAYSDSLHNSDFDERIIELEAQNKYEKKEIDRKSVV